LTKKASARLLELLNASAFTVQTFGLDGTGKRILATVMIAGRDVGDILIHEHLARRWPDGDEWWCCRSTERTCNDPSMFWAALLAYVAASPASAQERPPADLDKRATTLFETSYRDYCDTIGYTADLPMDRMEKFEFSYGPTDDAGSGPKNILVYRFFCAQGSILYGACLFLVAGIRRVAAAIFF
jgi:hypothetical protein